jgi:YD repeat-containing protein
VNLSKLLRPGFSLASERSKRCCTQNFARRHDALNASNPESGTATYTYDANGNLSSRSSPAPNQTGTATVTLSYCYDALNRLTAKAYTVQSCPMSSPVATYFYDQTSFNGLTIANGIGRRTGMTDPAGSEAWSYDAMGRIAVD